MSPIAPAKLGTTPSSVYDASTSSARSFVASALTLLSGAMLAQAVNLLSIPALTRCYTPADFGLLAIVTAIVTVVMSFATGRYEFALLVSENDGERARVLSLSCALALLTSATLALIATLVWLLDLTGGRVPGSWLVLIPTLVLLCGLSSVCNQYCIATGKFRFVATAEVCMVFLVTLSQLGFAVLGFSGGTPLIFGLVIGRAAAFAVVCGEVPRFVWNQRSELALEKLLSTAWHHRRFPTYTTLFELVAAASNEMPAFFLRLFFPAQVLGFFALSQRVLEKPVQLVNTSVAPVVLRRIAQIRNQSRDVNALLLKMSSLLFLAIVPPAIVLMIFNRWIFRVAFGPEWELAGYYAFLLAPLMVVRFATLPCWTGLIGRGKPQMMLVWTTIHFAISAVAMLVTLPFKSPAAVVMALSASGCVSHALLLVLNISLGDTTAPSCAGSRSRHSDVPRKAGSAKAA